MSLDTTLQRPTPTLPFVGSTGSQGVGYVPLLDARQYVALCAELALQPAPREQTLCRYQVPTEAAFRALDEQWQHPAQRAELEDARRRSRSRCAAACYGSGAARRGHGGERERDPGTIAARPASPSSRQRSALAKGP